MSDEGQAGGALLDDWMSRAELAAELGVTEDTLQRWHAQRSGPACVRVGKKVLYRREAVREWLVAREIQPVSRARAGR